MKISFFAVTTLAALSTLMISTFVLADDPTPPGASDEPAQIIPLNISDVVQEFGCGIQPPGGGTCPTSTTLAISMPGRQGCQKPEDFSVQVVQTDQAQELTIFRKKVPCGGMTFPPQNDVVRLQAAELLHGKPIRIMNPLALRIMPRP